MHAQQTPNVFEQLGRLRKVTALVRVVEHATHGLPISPSEWVATMPAMMRQLLEQMAKLKHPASDATWNDVIAQLKENEQQ